MTATMFVVDLQRTLICETAPSADMTELVEDFLFQIGITPIDMGSIVLIPEFGFCLDGIPVLLVIALVVLALLGGTSCQSLRLQNGEYFRKTLNCQQRREQRVRSKRGSVCDVPFSEAGCNDRSLCDLWMLLPTACNLTSSLGAASRAAGR